MTITPSSLGISSLKHKHFNNYIKKTKKYLELLININKIKTTKNYYTYKAVNTYFGNHVTIISAKHIY